MHPILFLGCHPHPPIALYLKAVVIAAAPNDALSTEPDSLYTAPWYEFKQNHKDWVNAVTPDLGPGTPAQIYAALETSTDNEKVSHSLTVWNQTREALTSLLKDDGILVIPTSPGPPPKLNMKENLLKDFWIRASTLLSIAGMSGCCQVSIPVGQIDKGLLAVSFIAGHGGDTFLLNFVQAIYYTLQEHVRIPSSTQPEIAEDAAIEVAKMANTEAIAAYTEKQWQKAIELFSEAIKLDGKNASYYNKRAAAHIQLRGYGQADKDCTAAIALNKKNFVVYLRRGIARERLGYWTGAVDDLKYLLLHDPPEKIGRKARFILKRLLS